MISIRIRYHIIVNDIFEAPREYELDVGNSIGVDGAEETTDSGGGVS